MGVCLVHQIESQIKSLKFYISCLFHARNSLPFKQSCMWHDKNLMTENVKEKRTVCTNFYKCIIYREGHDGFFKVISLKFIDSTDGSNSTRRDICWMRILRTLAPEGQNIDCECIFEPSYGDHWAILQNYCQ